MDYIQLSKIIETMGGKLSYSEEHGWHEYKLVFGRLTTTYRYAEDRLAIKNIESYLKEMYPIQFENSKRQLSIK